MVSLNDPSLLETRAYVDGAWGAAERHFDVVNPSTGEVVAQVADTTVADMTVAIDAAHKAQKSWAQWTGKDRGQVLHTWADLLIAHADDLATILTAEMGKPFAEARGEILYGASYLEWFSGEAMRVEGDVLAAPAPGKRLMVLKQPVGVVGSITPWNFPNAMIARKVGPALAVGCSFVARPSELTPLSALAMAVLAERAGVPAGVFNVLPSLDAAGVGQELCRNDKVAKITFTGSTRVGQILMEQSAPSLKRLSLELGGNAPFIVFDDADLDSAAKNALSAKFRNNGQTCVCANRIYVQAGVYDAFAEKLKARMETLSVGDGFAQGVTTGPMINEAAVAKVERQIADAVEKGGQVALGGARKEGLFFEPTLLTDVAQDMLICHEETFGPVAPLVRFDTEEQVIEMANDSEHGLSAYFFSRDIGRVWRVAEALETGMVGVNTGLISTELAPFGGVKKSGIGREGSKYGVEDYLDIKTVCLGDIN